MLQRFGAENQQEGTMNTAFPDHRIYYNLPEGQSRPSSGEANGGGHGHSSLTSIGDSRLDTLHLSNYCVDPTLLHQRHPGSAVGPSQFQYLDALVAVADTPPRAGSSAAEAKGSGITETSRNLYPSRSKLPPLAPALPSPSHIVKPRPSTRRRSHASASAVDRSDPQCASHSSSSVSVQVGHYNAASQRRRGRHASQRLSPRPSLLPLHPQARHVRSSLAPLSSPEPVGLQSTPSQNGRLKLSLQEHASRSGLLRNELWFKNQTEEPRVTSADEFVKREYIDAADKTRFNAFVWIDPGARRVVCRIPHDIIVKGGSVPCTYVRENVKEAVAHVSEYFSYQGYKCQSTAPGHPDPCHKRFPTRERRNDHQSKANKRPDARIDCALCNKSTLERNMERHKMKCKSKTGPASQPER